MSADTSPIEARWIEVARDNRDSIRFRVSLAAFRMILDGGLPSTTDIAESLDMSEDGARAIVHELRDYGRMTLTGDGNHITGAGGLSLIPSRHAVFIENQQFWGWCALDAVGIPAGLSANGLVNSACADTGEVVRIDIDAGRLRSATPDDLLISLVAPRLDRSLHDSCCSMIGFYRDALMVPGDAEAIRVADAMELGRDLWWNGVPL